MAFKVVWFGTKTTGGAIIFEALERVRRAETNLKTGIGRRLQRSSIASGLDRAAAMG